MTDIITALGHMCMGSRLKRLGERMQAGVAQVLKARGCPAQPSHIPLLVALAVEGELTIGALGQAVGISQPGATRAAGQLEAMGLVESVVPTGPFLIDRRQRAIALTAAGRALYEDLVVTLFPAVDTAVEALCREAGGDLLALLGAVEARLDGQPLDARIRDAGA